MGIVSTRVAGGVAATTGVALALVGVAGVAQADDGLGPVVATATTVVGADQLVDTVHANGLVYERTVHADGSVSGPSLMDESFTATAVALATKPNGDVVRVTVKNGQVQEQTAHNGLWGPGTVLAGPLSYTAAATTVLPNGDQLIDLVDSTGRTYEITNYATGGSNGPYILDGNTGGTAVALATAPNGDAVQVVLRNGRVQERTKHNGAWGPTTIAGTDADSYTAAATTVLPNGDQLVDLVDTAGRTYEVTNYAAGFSNGPYILDGNAGSTAVALATECDGDAVQDVVHNGAVQQRVKHNGAWGATSQLG